jgi:phospholipase/carboxylesterase
MSELLEHVTVDTSDNPEVSVIWLHGLGADGNDFVPIVRELDLAGLPGIRFIFPHARRIPVTVNGGYVMRAWYDITGAELTRREDENGLRASQLEVEAFIAREKARGIPASRIVLAGFSQGCAMTIQAGLRHPEALAGMICLSGYVPLSAKLALERSQESLATPTWCPSTAPKCRATCWCRWATRSSGTSTPCSTRCAWKKSSTCRRFSRKCWGKRWQRKKNSTKKRWR